MSILRHSVRFVVCVAVCLTITASSQADPPTVFQRMFKAKPIASAATSGKDLQVEDGPWMILAHTFVGENSRENAERLASEIQREISESTFIHHERFDFSQGPSMAANESRRVRYANPHQYDAYSVLVGEYDSDKHPSVAQDLRQIKSMQSAILGDKKVVADETNKLNPVTAIKAMQRKWVASNKEATRGPMQKAFLTRNPILPPEYFQSPAVDDFVDRMNRDLPNSLLQCDGKHTVIVRTFEGYSLLDTGKYDESFKPSMKRLDKCAEDANKMTAALRKKGIEAYQFHDRTKSIVTIGSFETLGRALPDGSFEYSPEIRRVMNDYRAFNVRPELASQVPLGQNGAAANSIANIPFDVQPKPMTVPKRSKKSMLSRAFRR